MFSEMKQQTLFEKANRYALEYVDGALERNVYPSEKALEGLQKFEEVLPEEPGDAEKILDLLNTYGAPATVSQIGGRYFGFVNGGAVPAGLAAKNLSIFWDQNSAMQVMSPIASKLERVVQKWLVQLFGLPAETAAGFVSGTSMANFCGLAAARFRMLKNLGWDINEQGLFDAPKIRVVTCTQAHSTILKAISLIGYGKANIEWVDVDDQGRIIPELIPELDDRTILVLQAGNVNSGSFDDLERICKVARSKRAWVHIDGAFGLWAGATKRLKHLTKGFELANSWSVDGHKTLNTPYDSGIILCADQEALASSLHMSAGYIVVGDDRDGMFYTPEMSRRARVIELWATMKYLGRNGIDEMIFGMHQRARQFAGLLKEIEGFQVLNDVVFNQVIVRCENDEITDKTISKIQELRTCWVGVSIWQNRKIIRISVCSWATTEQDVILSVDSFKQAYEAVKLEMIK